MEVETNLVENEKPKTFEDLLTYIKPFGLWQILIVALTIYAQIFLAMATLIVTFYQITPDYACKLPIPNQDYQKWTLEEVQNFSSPINKDGDRDNCQIYNLNYSTLVSSNYNLSMEKLAEVGEPTNETQLLTCHSWKYDRSAMAETVVTQWDLVCKNKWMVEHGLLLNFLGFFFGSLISGFISDKIGRKKAFLGAMAFMGVSGTILSFVTNYTSFMIIRFVFAMGKISASLTNYCYTLESTTGKTRTWVAGLIFVPYACGYSLLAGIAYLTRDWRYLNLCVCVPCLLPVFLWPIIPESPRWLLVVGRLREAKKVLKQAARLNGRELPDVDLGEISSDLNKEQTDKTSKNESFLEILKYKTLVFRAVIVWFLWIINSMVYYGLALNISTFSGDVFLNNALAGAPVEIPAYFITTALLHLGRKPALYLSLFFCGACLATTPWIPGNLNWLKVGLGLAGKLGITISYSAIYVFTTELYPTVIRNAGLSTSSAVARFGPMLAPYISSMGKLGKSYAWLPLLIFGSVALSGVFLTFLLPETLGRRMPEHFADALKIGKGKETKNDSTEMSELKPSNDIDTYSQM